MKKSMEVQKKDSVKETVSIRKQLSRIITFCCIIAVGMQAIIMVVMVLNQYVSREKENIYYLIEQDNKKIDMAFQYLSEMVLAIQNDAELNRFFQEESYDEEKVTEQLKNVTNLFSQRNRMEDFEPFVEKVYLFQETGKSIFNLYYPLTISEKNQSQNRYKNMYERYRKNKILFYCEADDRYFNLCLQLYDIRMEPVGVCIFALNKEGIKENFSNLERLNYYTWSISQEGNVILGEEKGNFLRSRQWIQHEKSTAFHLNISTKVPMQVVYGSIGTIIGVVIFILLVLWIVLTVLGNRMTDYYVRPLENIAEKIKMVGKGNFKTKLDDYQVEELQRISRTFNEMTDYIEHLIKEVYENKLLAQEMQIRYLQAQMDPHFLFNVLSMIKIKAAMNRDVEVQEMLHQLSGLYQGKIFKKEEYFIFLEEEMEIIDFYLSLQKKRFGEKINFTIVYEGDMETYRNFLVPRLSIEPIVENAVVHGLEPKAGDGQIGIKIFQENRVLKIEIEDDGVGFEAERNPEEKEDKKHNKVGLWNTNKMIQNLCGEEFGLQIESKPGKGTKVWVYLPVRNGERYVESNDCR